MTQEEVEAIKKRLEQSINSLESQTTALKNDLKAINEFLEKKENLKPKVAEKLNEAESKTQEQIKANQKLLDELASVDKKEYPEPNHISDLEERTVAMLERMQQKVSAREIISDLYEDLKSEVKPEENNDPKNTENQSAESSDESSAESSAEKVEDPIEEAKKIRAEQEMENTVKKIKDQDALDELKKKLGMK